MKQAGIYIIRDLENNKVYVGSSKNPQNRKYEHFSNLRNNKHKNEHLQNAWNKYGERNFVFEIVENCNLNNLIEREIYFINKFDSLVNTNGYNKLKPSGTHFIHSEESIGKMKFSRKDYRPTKETKQKTSKTMSEKPLTEKRLEILKKMQEGRKGTFHTLETKQTISKTKTGVSIWTLEERQQMSIDRKGVKKNLTNEERQRRSDFMKNRNVSSKTKTKMAEKKSKAVLKINELGEIVAEYKSLKYLKNRTNKRNKDSYNFMWKYK